MSETAPRHASDITTHPDAREMQERFAKVVQGPRATALDGMVVLLGMYLAISPWVVHSIDANLRVNNLVIGLTLAAFGFGLALQPERLYRLGWICVPVGVWMIISPWVVTVGHTAGRAVIWNNVAIGAVAVLLGLASQGMTMGAVRRRR
ncbi:SPW repeat protein [Catenulispora acidiphila DSM 44928]|uniref:SPW repeat protein n=1 Tax=Catenulispora acidiphila (strain DSM 44928 / JCM 14897 / NBRC 102108 / NRRL B-24433 / ID139908) TaxID=479433 RepID=C7Q9F8_CATAD|nr:SPW repeat protein [Catenulispora acidiphila]ACU74304.1 SPW repeat protein [Catenulispora acidiphila DSM 44928]